MLGLAEFVMRGRLQALLVAVVGAASTLFCWVGAAVIALVTLRKGAGEGAWLLLWASLPALALALVYGDSGPLCLLLGTTGMAIVLRNSVSLSLAVLASIAVGFLTGLAYLYLSEGYVASLVELLQQVLQQLVQGSATSESAPAVPQVTAGTVAGLLGVGTALMAVLSLLLARYWQAALYNPGGFGQEFKALRYPVGVTLVLVVAGLALASLGLSMRTWAMLCFVPLSFAGLALVHSWAERRGRGTFWLGAFYIAWLLLDPLKLLVVFMAIADSWADFRQRWAVRDTGRQDRIARDDSREADERDDNDS